MEDTGEIPCAVWYPAVGGKTRAVYDLGTFSRSGQARTDAKPDASGGPYPLVVYSHGYAGCSVSSAYLCESLAAAGFVVAAPDHSDDLKVCSLCPGYRPEPFVGLKILFSAIDLANHLSAGDYDVQDFRYRLIQIMAVIDHLLAENRDDRSPFFDLIDAGRIGAVGHSLGGFSVMVAAGARHVGIDFPIDAVVAMSGTRRNGLFLRRHGTDHDPGNAHVRKTGGRTLGKGNGASDSIPVPRRPEISHGTGRG